MRLQTFSICRGFKSELAAILEARRTTGVVTPSLKSPTCCSVSSLAPMRAEEFSAAHNAAFSLARIYGHVTDKSVIEHIRRPSRDPDAPSETALEAWAASLPVVSPDPQLRTASEAPLQGPPAPLLGPEPSPHRVDRGQLSAGSPLPIRLPSPGPRLNNLKQHQGLSGEDHLSDRPVLGQDREGTHVDVHWISGPGPGDGPGGIGNGAPVGPVTGTSNTMSPR